LNFFVFFFLTAPVKGYKLKLRTTFIKILFFFFIIQNLLEPTFFKCNATGFPFKMSILKLKFETNLKTKNRNFFCLPL
jgi:hypothetical protein